MLKKIEYLIPEALKAIDTHLLTKYPNGILTGYQGAASGFGTTLMQMGLLPTLAVYTDKDNNADIDRQILLQVLITIVENDKRFNSDTTPLNDINTLLRNASHQPKAWRKEFTEHLLRASLVFKLTLRTYHLKKSN